ncbi:MAG: hypothetical protein GY754_05200 [bacterium]|nr:hypothetical protein [bacterium]
MKSIKINDLTMESGELKKHEAAMTYGGGLTGEEAKDALIGYASASLSAPLMGATGAGITVASIFFPPMAIVGLGMMALAPVMPALITYGTTVKLIEDIRD